MWMHQVWLPGSVRWPGSLALAGPAVAPPARRADFSVGDLVVQQGVQLRGFGAGVPEPTSDGLDGDAGVDELGAMGVVELVDVDADPGVAAVALPAVVGGVVGQRARPIR
jgi:hypothetical protein